MASVLHGRRRMKKEPGNNMDNNHLGSGIPSSRPSSASSVSSKASTTKKQKDKGPSKEDLLKANSELFREVEAMNHENQLLKSTLSAVIDKFVENAKIKGIKVPSDVENPNVCEIPAESLVSLTERLTAESHKSNTMEFRIEELETRITHLNMELAKLLRTRVNVENGLDEIVKEYSNIDDVRNKGRELIRELRSNSLFTFLDSVPVEDSIKKPEPVVLQQQDASRVRLKQRTQSNSITVQLNNENLDLTPPLKKMAGDTHIKQMHKDLRQYLIQQLSLQKGNGADWRLMGDRLGIPEETIQQWKRWKLDQPMTYVLQTWSQSPGATVRLLHRHLVSPQMRSTLLAKRLSDFYQVD